MDRWRDGEIDIYRCVNDDMWKPTCVYIFGGSRNTGEFNLQKSNIGDKSGGVLFAVPI